MKKQTKRIITAILETLGNWGPFDQWWSNLNGLTQKDVIKELKTAIKNVTVALDAADITDLLSDQVHALHYVTTKDKWTIEYKPETGLKPDTISPNKLIKFLKNK